MEFFNRILIINNGTSAISLKHLQILLFNRAVVKKQDEIIEDEWKQFDLIILSGSSRFSVVEKKDRLIQEKKIIMNQKIPVVGICWGAELIIEYHNGKLKEMKKEIHGKRKIKFNNGVKAEVFEHHKWRIDIIPKEFNVLATSKENGVEVIEFFEHKKYPLYGMQFHPEAGLNNLEINNFLDGDEIFFELLNRISKK